MRRDDTPTPLYDGRISFQEGCNEVSSLDRATDLSFYRGVNLRIKGTSLTPRYGQREISVLVEEEEYQKIYDGGKIQAFIPVPDSKSILEVISGFFFLTDTASGRTTLLSKELTVNEFISRINWSYAEDYIEIYDYPNLPIIYSRARGELRRSNLKRMGLAINPLDPDGALIPAPEPETPVTELGTYNTDRVFSGVGTGYTASDPVSIGFPDAPITFIETYTANTGFTDQIFGVGNSSPSERLTAMGFLKVADTTTGYGPLLLSTANNIYAADVSRPRDEWVGRDFLKLALPNLGISGQRAFVNVTNDVLFIDPLFNLRSFGLDLGNQKRWDSSGISRGVEELLSSSDTSLASFAIVGYWDNKVFVTIEPNREIAKRSDGKEILDYTFKSILVLDFAPYSRLGEGSSPAFLGVWNLAPVAEMGVVDNQLYFKTKLFGRNSLFVVDKTLKYDVVGGKRREIESRVDFKKLGFGNRYGYKEMRDISLELDDVRGDFDMSVFYKPSGGGSFGLYKKFSRKVDLCTPLFGKPLTGQSLGSLKLGGPEEIPCNEGTGDLQLLFKDLDLRFEMKGWWELTSFVLRAEAKVDTSLSNVNCQAEEIKGHEFDCLSVDDFNYGSVR